MEKHNCEESVNEWFKHYKVANRETLCEFFGIDPHNYSIFLRTIFKGMGLELPNYTEESKKITEVIISMRKQGYTQKEISEELGLSKHAVAQRISRYLRKINESN